MAIGLGKDELKKGIPMGSASPSGGNGDGGLTVDAYTKEESDAKYATIERADEIAQEVVDVQGDIASLDADKENKLTTFNPIVIRDNVVGYYQNLTLTTNDDYNTFSRAIDAPTTVINQDTGCFKRETMTGFLFPFKVPATSVILNRAYTSQDTRSRNAYIGYFNEDGDFRPVILASISTTSCATIIYGNWANGAWSYTYNSNVGAAQGLMTDYAPKAHSPRGITLTPNAVYWNSYYNGVVYGGYVNSLSNYIPSEIFSKIDTVYWTLPADSGAFYQLRTNVSYCGSWDAAGYAGASAASLQKTEPPFDVSSSQVIHNIGLKLDTTKLNVDESGNLTTIDSVTPDGTTIVADDNGVISVSSDLLSRKEDAFQALPPLAKRVDSQSVAHGLTRSGDNWNAAAVSTITWNTTDHNLTMTTLAGKGGTFAPKSYLEYSVPEGNFSVAVVQNTSQQINTMFLGVKDGDEFTPLVAILANTCGIIDTTSVRAGEGDSTVYDYEGVSATIGGSGYVSGAMEAVFIDRSTGIAEVYWASSTSWSSMTHLNYRYTYSIPTDIVGKINCVIIPARVTSNAFWQQYPVSSTVTKYTGIYEGATFTTSVNDVEPAQKFTDAVEKKVMTANNATTSSVGVVKPDGTSIIVDASGTISVAIKIHPLTQAQYDALATKDPNVLYVIVPEEEET